MQGRRTRLTILLAFLAVVGAGALTSQPASARQSQAVPDEQKKAADIVFKNGAIYTMDSARSWATCLAVSGGRIAFVGSQSNCQPFIGPSTNVIDLKGKMVLPGFNDAHVHLGLSGLEMEHCRLDDAYANEEALALIKKYVAIHPFDKWIQGGGWSLPLFPESGPVKADLDAIDNKRPIFMRSQDAHSAWVNSVALDLAKITKDTPDPPLGKIERLGNGEPSGTLRESAVDLVEKLIPEPEPEEADKAVLWAISEAHKFGITGIQEANTSQFLLDCFKRLEDAGKLNIHVIAALPVNPAKDESQVDGLLKLREKYSTQHLHPTSAKIFADGVIEAHTAALIEPYLDRKEAFGILNYEPERLNKLVSRLDKNGFQVHIHAIGDRAIRCALDAFEKCGDDIRCAENRHQIAHLEVIDSQDLPRFRKLGIIANFEPYWAFADPYIMKMTLPVLGMTRGLQIYTINSMINSGALVSFGSDWNVSSLNPLDGIQVAVTRKALTQKGGLAFIPKERIDLAQALACYTIRSAYANHMDKETGSLEKGKLADLIVLDHNIFDVDPSEIHDTKVLMTLFEGKVVYKDAAM